MKHFPLAGTLRTASGKAALKALRAQGLVPCNLYGQGMENVLFSVSEKELKGLTHTPASYLVELKLDDGREFLATLHEAQWHPKTDAALHMDFLVATDKQPVTIAVPVKITGHSEGVKMGGKLAVSARKIKVCAMLDKLPDEVEVDITSLQIGKRIVAGDLKLDGVEVVSPKATIICSVRATRASATAETAE